MKRTAAEIGAAFRARRLMLNLKQDEIPGVSSATVRNIEKGTETNPTERIRVNFARGLRWEPDAYELLRDGSEPRETVHHTVSLGEALLKIRLGEPLDPLEQRALDTARMLMPPSEQQAELAVAWAQRNHERLDELEDRLEHRNVASVLTPFARDPADFAAAAAEGPSDPHDEKVESRVSPRSDAPVEPEGP